MQLGLFGTLKRLNVELAKGEQALVCLRQIERPTSNIQYEWRCALSILNQANQAEDVI